MSDVDASAAIELEGDSLAAGLDQIAARFAEISSQINGQFSTANAQLTRTATSAQQIGAAAPAVASFGAWLTQAANAGRLLFATFAAISKTAVLLAPLVKHIPDSLATWVPKLKEVAAEHVKTAAQIGLVTKAAAALSGRLSIVSAAFGAMEARTLGATRQQAIFGAASALAMSKTIAGARGAMAAVASLGAVIGRSAAGFSRGLGSAFGGMGRNVAMVASLGAPMAGLALSLGPVGAAAVGVAVGFSAVHKSINAAAETQTLQTSFVTLLGSMDAARKRMAELSKFAADTPFEIPQVVKASKVLETLTHGALSTGAGLRLAGDAAAMSGQPIEELSVHIGRLYDGLTNGRPVGEAMARLQELGLISSDTRAEIEGLQKSGAKGADVWKLAAADLGRFSGEMARQSGTWAGMMSNLSDGVGNLFRAFGAPVISHLTPFMQRLLAWVGSLTVWAEKAGGIFAGWSALIAQVFTDGKMGEALVKVGKVAVGEWINFAMGNLVGLGNVLLTIFGGIARAFVSLLAAATTSQFWSGLGNALKSAGAALMAMLAEGVARVLDMLRDVPKIGEAAGRAADRSRDFAASMADTSATAGGQAGANLAPLFATWGDDVRATMKKAGESFAEGKKMGGDLIDTASAKAELLKWVQPFAKAAQDSVKAAAKAAEAGGLPAPLRPGDPNAADGGKGGKNDVASLQRIGGGGGFSISRADPLLAEARSQTSEIKGLRQDMKALKDAVTQRRPGADSPIFGR